MLEVEITINGWIDKEWSDWLGGLAISHCDPDYSRLTGVLPDQPAVYGMIARMRDYGFQLTTVRIKKTKKDDERN